MKFRFIFCFALLLSGILACISAEDSYPKESPALRVVIIASKTEIRLREPFSLALRVENPTKTNQTVRVMNCSWDDEWLSSNPKIQLAGSVCTKNFAVNVVIPPGGAYTNESQILIYDPIPEKELSFKMGFTSIGSKDIFWSNEIKLHMLH